MEQFVILLVIAAISFINWLLQKSAEHKKQRSEQARSEVPEGQDSAPWAPWEVPDAPMHKRSEPDFPQESRRSAEPDAEEQMRRLFEALGLPTPEPEKPRPLVTPSFDTAPPPLPIPHPPIPPVSSVASTAPAASAAPPKPTLRENREMRELAAAFERNAVDASSDTGTQAIFRNLLRDPHQIRQGIILREILGPPKAFES